MKKISPEQALESLRTLTPKASVLASLEERVFSQVNPRSIPSPLSVQKSGLFFSWQQLQLGVVAFSCLLLAVYIVPKHTAYQTSLSSLAETEHITDAFGAEMAPAAPLEESLDRTRDAFNALSLDGTIGLYTQAQCEEAYILYDGYLDRVTTLVDEKLATATSDEQKQSLARLKDTIASYKAEAGKRMMLYPKQ